MDPPPLFPSQVEIQKFCAQNAEKSITKLRLQRPNAPHWGILLNQLEVRQSMSERFAPLVSVPGYLFPGKGRLSQASSAATALWKGKLIASHLAANAAIWDATGGSGIDSWGLEQAGARVTSTEPESELVALLRHNAEVLGVPREVLSMPSEALPFRRFFDAIYVDPSRQDDHGNRVYHPASCQPNALEEVGGWLRRAPWVWIKLSPMVDPDEVLQWFPQTAFLYTVGVGREVKEVLIGLSRDSAKATRRFAVALHGQGGESYSWEVDTHCPKPALSDPKRYLYDADAALVAARGIPTVAAALGLSQLHPESRLLTSDTYHGDFPGRCFELRGIHPPFKGSWPQGASVVVRGFPEKADIIRKRMRLKENAEYYLIATVWGENQRGFLEAVRIFPHEDAATIP